MYYLIDVGSSSVKLYSYASEETHLIKKFSYKFGKVYTSEVQEPIEQSDKDILFDIFKKMMAEYPLKRNNTKLFATGHFRNISNKHELVNEFYQQTNLYFNIIGQDLELFYLDNKFMEYSKNIGPTIAIDIGGGSTEFVCYSNGKAFHSSQKLPFGVNVIRKLFSDVNTTNKQDKLDEIVAYVLSQLPDKKEIYSTAILTGGELTFMQRCEYPLKKNTLINDKHHPYMIDVNAYTEYNSTIYAKNIEYLLNKMPENPIWMEGARAYCAIAQAFCIKYGIKNIIPSDFTTIDGIIMQEAKTVTVCGSFNKHLDKIAMLIRQLKSRGFEVLSPNNTDVVGDERGFVLFKNDIIKNHCTWPIEAQHLQAIRTADIVIVCNYDNYIGFSTIFELGAAYMSGKKIVFIEDNELARKQDSPLEIGMLI